MPKTYPSIQFGDLSPAARFIFPGSHPFMKLKTEGLSNANAVNLFTGELRRIEPTALVIPGEKPVSLLAFDEVTEQEPQAPPLTPTQAFMAAESRRATLRNLASQFNGCQERR